MAQNTLSNKSLYIESLKYVPGGVHSPVRSFYAVKSTPFFVKKAKGVYLDDVEGKKYLDYVMSWGASILGHSFPLITKKIASQLPNGLSFGAASLIELQLAQIICQSTKLIEKLRFVSTGTEACMTAIRLARGFSKRKIIIKFAGCYHGHSDSLLVKGGSGLATFGIPVSAGVLPEVASKTLVLPYNDEKKLVRVFRKYGSHIAGVIVEPIAANMGVVIPTPEFINTLNICCQKNKTILISDEVITGFRFRYGLVSEVVGLKPDLICLGKIIGGGFPVAAIGGKKVILDVLAPLGSVYQAGTLSGNPVGMACGLATLTTLKNSDYQALGKNTTELCQQLRLLAKKYQLPVIINQYGSLFTIFFTPNLSVNNYETASTSKLASYALFFKTLLSRGIFFPPSQFEACFVSFGHKQKHFQKTLQSAEYAFKLLHDTY